MAREICWNCQSGSAQDILGGLCASCARLTDPEGHAGCAPVKESEMPRGGLHICNGWTCEVCAKMRNAG